MRSSVFWRSGRDSNPRYAFDVHTISSRARYDRFDTTPYAIVRGGLPRFGSIVVGQSSLISIYQNIEFVNCFFHFFREALFIFSGKPFGFYLFPPPQRREGPDYVIARPVRRLVVAIRNPRPLFPMFSNGNLKTPPFSIFNSQFSIRPSGRGRREGPDHVIARPALHKFRQPNMLR